MNNTHLLVTLISAVAAMPASAAPFQDKAATLSLLLSTDALYTLTYRLQSNQTYAQPVDYVVGQTACQSSFIEPVSIGTITEETMSFPADFAPPSIDASPATIIALTQTYSSLSAIDQ